MNEQQQSSIHHLFKRCAGCGDELIEGAVFDHGIPVCVECYAGDRCKIRTYYYTPNSEEKTP